MNRAQAENQCKKIGLLLKEGAIFVMPTDTIYGILGSALSRKTVEKIYRLKKRSQSKPAIVLISSLNDLKKFGVHLSFFQEKILKKIWPGRISAVLKCPSGKFSYIRRGFKSITFRMPAEKKLLEIISLSGPLIAPSANFENFPPAKNIAEAKKYFGKSVIYCGNRKTANRPSTIIDFTGRSFKILRKGSGYNFLAKTLKL